MQRATIYVWALSAGLIWGAGPARAQFTFGEPENLGPEVNGADAQTGASVSADGLAFYYTSGAVMPFARGNGDIYVRTRESADLPWGEPRSLGAPVNTAAYEGEPSISADGDTLYFSDGNYIGPFDRRPGGLGEADLWVTTREAENGEWRSPRNLGKPVNSPFMDAGPCISRNGLSLYFASDRPDGSGAMDLYVARRPAADEPWGEPENLGPLVNSSSHDADPAISADGRYLFFTSERDPNWGFGDLWVATRATKSDPWGAPEHFGAVINTNTGDWTPALSHDGSTLFFSHWHDKPRGELGRGGFGQMDLWRIPIVAYPPMPDFTVSPENGEAPVTVRVDGSASAAAPEREITSYEWDFGQETTATGVEAEHSYEQPGRYFIELTVTDDQGSTWTTRKPVTVGCASGDVSPWTSTDIGETLIPGAARIEDGSGEEALLAICAGGRPLSQTEEALHYAYQEASGDTVLTARVASLGGGPNGAQVGVMLRESLERDAAYAAMTLRSAFSASFRFHFRENAGESSRFRRGPRDAPLPGAWVRIERRGHEFIAWASTDGDAWEEVERRVIEGFPDTYYAGVFAGAGAQREGVAFEAVQTQIRVAPGAEPRFRRGDCNGDGNVDISDAVATLGSLFLGESHAGCDDACDSNDDGSLDISDAIATLEALFLGEGPLPLPGEQDCGADPTGDAMGCSTSPQSCG